MRSISIILIAASLVALVNSLPLVQNENIDPRTLDHSMMVDDNDETSHRTQRSIGILRQFFPEISQNAVNRLEYQEIQETSEEASENNEVRVSFEDVQSVANEAIEPELTPLEDMELSDDNRNKRLVNSGGSSSGSVSGGSGNFLFDIIRLVAGSGSSSSDGSSTTSHTESDEAVPGPATRFLVIANRGISNLIQDLILRIAATSERFVNFKARLITSII